MDSEFQRKNRAQFQRARAALQETGRKFIYFVAADLVEATPGFGNQYDGTRYIPTGRLRGGWNWTRSPIMVTSKGYNVLRHEDGPFSDDGRETVARIEAQTAGRIGGISYLENDVAYGSDIVRGENNHSHIGPRDFPVSVKNRQFTHAKSALNSLR